MENVALESFTVSSLSRSFQANERGTVRMIASSRTQKGKPAAHALRRVPITSTPLHAPRKVPPLPSCGEQVRDDMG